MTTWPLDPSGRLVTSPFGPRGGAQHTGVDLGFTGGSGGKSVYAAEAGVVTHAGASPGFGGPSPAGWVVIAADTTTTQVYGHVVAEVAVGQRVTEGQRIARVNPDPRTYGDSTAPHLHFEWHTSPQWASNTALRVDPLPWLAGAREPGHRGGTVGWQGDPVWLADVLREEGLRVVEMPGWKERGHGDFGDVWGVLWHHTGGNNTGPDFIRVGRPDLEGPLSQLHLSRDGTFTVIAAGIAWHAGAGSWPGIAANTGNSRLIGIEADSDGKSPWPPEQLSAYRRGTAAILRRLGYDSSHMIGHKEYGAIQGKWDPGGLDMKVERAEVQKLLGGGGAAPPVSPESWPLPPGYYYGPYEGPEESISGRAGEPAAWVEGLRQFQRWTKVAVTGVYDEATKGAAQQVQRLAQFRPDGLIGPGTFAAAKKAAAAPPAPTAPEEPSPPPERLPDLLQETWDQLRGPGGQGWKQLNQLSLVDAVAEIGKALGLPGFGAPPPA